MQRRVYYMKHMCVCAQGNSKKVSNIITKTINKKTGAEFNNKQNIRQAWQMHNLTWTPRQVPPPPRFPYSPFLCALPNPTRGQTSKLYNACSEHK